MIHSYHRQDSIECRDSPRAAKLLASKLAPPQFSFSSRCRGAIRQYLVTSSASTKPPSATRRSELVWLVVLGGFMLTVRFRASAGAALLVAFMPLPLVLVSGLHGPVVTGTLWKVLGNFATAGIFAFGSHRVGASIAGGPDRDRHRAGRSSEDGLDSDAQHGRTQNQRRLRQLVHPQQQQQRRKARSGSGLVGPASSAAVHVRGRQARLTCAS